MYFVDKDRKIYMYIRHESKKLLHFKEELFLPRYFSVNSLFLFFSSYFSVSFIVISLSSPSPSTSYPQSWECH